MYWSNCLSRSSLLTLGVWPPPRTPPRPLPLPLPRELGNPRVGLWVWPAVFPCWLLATAFAAPLLPRPLTFPTEFRPRVFGFWGCFAPRVGLFTGLPVAFPLRDVFAALLFWVILPTAPWLRVCWVLPFTLLCFAEMFRWGCDRLPLSFGLVLKVGCTPSLCFILFCFSKLG